MVYGMVVSLAERDEGVNSQKDTKGGTVEDTDGGVSDFACFLYKFPGRPAYGSSFL
jgi:hypothetical protein